MNLISKIASAAGAMILVITLVLWLACGANAGWSKTYITTPQVDPITEITFYVKSDRLLPGVDFLATGCLIGGVLLLTSKLLAKKP